MFKFILPDWDDLVDPNFNFITEEHGKDYLKDRYRYGARIWHFYNPPPINGVLVSRSLIDPPKKRTISSKLMKIKREGIKEFLNLPASLRDPSRFQVIGDCGAWQYVNESRPPYSVEGTLEFYNAIGVDYGVSVDHIAAVRDPDFRMQITYENAVKSYEIWKQKSMEGEYRFTLLGAIQGYEISDYVIFMKRLYEIGYRHFALGGLAKRNTKFISKLIENLKEFLRRKRDVVKIHFLGIARPEFIPRLKALTELVEDISLDNATFLRLAWTRTHGNYLIKNCKLYTAIRIRYNSKMEHEILEYLHNYAEGKVGFEKTLNILREYLAINGEISYLPYYVVTLRDKPWEKCECRICKEAGIDVVIFRGNDRNRRRGFHNIWTFSQLFKNYEDIDRKMKIMVDRAINKTISFQDKYKIFLNAGLNPKNIRKIAIITYCTQEKNIDLNRVARILSERGLSLPGFDLEREKEYWKILRAYAKRAEDMYSGTFKYVRKLIGDLRKSGFQIDVYILSARYGLITGDTIIIPYDATLKDLNSVQIKEWASKRKVNEKLMDILNKQYELIIINLNKDYIKPIKEVLEKIINNNKVLAILPLSKHFKQATSKSLIMYATNIKRRVQLLKLLREYFSSTQLKLTEFFEM